MLEGSRAAGIGSAASSSFQRLPRLESPQSWELAHRTNAQLWNLAAFHVGDNTFEGTLAATLGMQPAAEELKRLQAGESLLVIDALDEGKPRRT